MKTNLVVRIFFVWSFFGLNSLALAEDAAAPAHFQHVSVVGHGAAPTAPSLSRVQKHLLGVRAAKLDAYRMMAEQLDGLVVIGHTTVKDLAAQSDRVRAMVSAYLQGVRIVKIDHVGEGMYEAVAEMDFDPAKLRQLAGAEHLDIQEDRGPSLAPPSSAFNPAHSAVIDLGAE